MSQEEIQLIYRPPDGEAQPIRNLVLNTPVRLTDDEWCEGVTRMMTEEGWTKDRDNETTLGFFFIQGEYHWIKDYDKKTRWFVQFNGNQMVSIKVTKSKESE